MSFQYVRIYYGPYDAFHTVSHKPQKLKGLRASWHPLLKIRLAKSVSYTHPAWLKDWRAHYTANERLHKLGYRIDLVPVEFINYCMLEMCGHEVFRCNIQNLQFNTPAELDPVCLRAVNAVVDASARFLRARNYLWFWALIDNQLFRRSEYAPKDHWPFEVDKESFDTWLECLTCCGSLVKEKK